MSKISSGARARAVMTKLVFSRSEKTAGTALGTALESAQEEGEALSRGEQSRR